MSRYTITRPNPCLIHVRDSKHNGLVAATVFLTKTVDGEGWKLAPMSVGRVSSRRLHTSPEQAIASMKYMTLKEAREAIRSRPIENSWTLGDLTEHVEIVPADRFNADKMTLLERRCAPGIVWFNVRSTLSTARTVILFESLKDVFPSMMVSPDHQTVSFDEKDAAMVRLSFSKR